MLPLAGVNSWTWLLYTNSIPVQLSIGIPVSMPRKHVTLFLIPKTKTKLGKHSPINRITRRYV